MPKEKWLVDPAELDEFQREILDLSLDDSYVISGCAGSGKTILALHRANAIRIQALAENEHASASFTMVVYTKTLKDFIRAGIVDLGIDIRQVIHNHKWDGSPVDYIVIDEVQDFNPDDVDIFFGVKGKSIMMYGDSNQQLYHDRLSLSTEAIAARLGLPQKELLRNYRLPKAIAAFAAYVGDDAALESKCVKPGAEKPRLKKFNSWQEELDFIMNEIKTRNYGDVAILLPFNNVERARHRNAHRNVESVKAYFDSKSFNHEAKMSDDEGGVYDLDFDSELPKVMPFHSSKGLQFETVFIPFCDYPCHDGWFIERYKNALYVALTRTYRNLYLTYSGNLSPFFAGIPPFKYE